MKKRIITLCVGFLLVHAYIWKTEIINAQTAFEPRFGDLFLNANISLFPESYDPDEMIFAPPMADDIFQENLAAVIVIHKSEEESLVFNRALLRFQTIAAPTSRMNAQVAYMPKFEGDPAFSDDRSYTRQQVYGIEMMLTLGEGWELNTEYALNQSYTEAETDPKQSQTFQTRLDGTVGERFEFHGSYQLEEGTFLPFVATEFAPSDFVSREQQIELSGTYFYHPEHSLTLGYHFSYDNVPCDSENLTTTTHRPFVEWNARIREHTNLFLTYEYIRETDDQNPKGTDGHTHNLLIGGTQEFLQAPLLKNFVLHGEYHLSDFEDRIDQTASTLTHQVVLRGNTEPVEGLALYIGQQEWFVHDKNLKKNTKRRDLFTIGVNLDRWERFSAQSQYQYRMAYDLLRDELESKGHAMTFSSQYTPFSVVTTSGRLTLRDQTSFPADNQEGQRSSQMLNLEGQVLYMPTQNLTLQAQYNYGQSKERTDTTSITREDTAEFRINYTFYALKTRFDGTIEFERNLSETPPTSTTETRTMTYLANVARQLTDRWDAMVQYKREVGTFAVDTVRNDILGEINYSSGGFLEFVAGYQYTAFTDNSDPMNTYTANLMYTKLIGKL